MQDTNPLLLLRKHCSSELSPYCVVTLGIFFFFSFLSFFHFFPFETVSLPLLPVTMWSFISFVVAHLVSRSFPKGNGPYVAVDLLCSGRGMSSESLYSTIFPAKNQLLKHFLNQMKPSEHLSSAVLNDQITCQNLKWDWRKTCRYQGIRLPFSHFQQHCN